MKAIICRKMEDFKPFRNVEFLPFYYFIPKRILQQCGEKLNSIPRNPRKIIGNQEACRIIESDQFRLLIIDAVAYLVWPFMGNKEYMEIYSGYDPAWIFAHSPGYWIQHLTDVTAIPTASNLLENCNEDLGYVPEEWLSAILKLIVPQAMERFNMHAVIKAAKEFRCFEDFDFRESRQKTDFYRKWYHTRVKHQTISLEDFRKEYAEQHHGQKWEPPDEIQDVEEVGMAQALIDEFKATLSEKDKAILQMRLKGYTYERIAKELGYKNHTGVSKRIKKIGLAYQAFTGEYYGFEDKKVA